MKPLFSMLLIGLFSCSFAQSDEAIQNLQNQITNNKQKVERLQSDVNQVINENVYLKDVLDIQKPINEGTADNTNYKVIAVRGDKEKRTIHVEVMVESTNTDKKFEQVGASIVDILGNVYGINFFMTTNYNAVQYKDIPIKITFGFEKVADEPKFLKMFEIRASAKPIGGSYSDKYKTSVQFKDLPIAWK